MPQTIRERAVLSRAFRDHGYQDRQAFLRPAKPQRPLISEGVVAHLITAIAGGLAVIVLVGGRYAG